MANTLAYYDTATINAVKFFIVQAPGGLSKDPTAWLDGATPYCQCFIKLYEFDKLEILTNSVSTFLIDQGQML